MYKVLPLQFHGIAESPAQPVQNGLDAGNAVALGNQKGDQGFPGILTEDPKPLPIGHRFFHKGIDEKILGHGLIVPVQIKIIPPHFLKILGCSAKKKASLIGPYPGGASKGYAHITAQGGFLPAEALAAGKDMLQGEGKIQGNLNDVFAIN